jgi:outer membrane protein, adhesin transport system
LKTINSDRFTATKPAALGAYIMFSFGICMLNNGALAADSLTASSRPNTTLSAAANAANAAVEAANSAAAAANAAAAAAAAAVQAMNAILPASERITARPATPLITSTKEAGVATDTQNKTNEIANVLDTMSSENTSPLEVTPSFISPSERTLSGLIGNLEVAVDADARKQFSAGVKSFRSNEASPVENVSGIDLGQAVTASLGFSRDVLVANARLNQAVAQTGQARAFMLPSLLVNVKAGRESSTPGAQIDTTTGREVARSVHNRQDTIVTLRQPILDVAGLYDWKRRKVIESSRQEGIRASQGDTYVATVNAYLALASTRIQANMAIDYENQLKELFQYIDKRAKAGAASNSDKERVRARMLSAKSARIEQEAAQAAAGIELVRLINLAPTSLRLPELEDVGASIVPKTLDEAMPKSLEANPDIASLRAELDAAGLDKNVAKARFLPTLNLEYSDTNSVHAGGQSGSQHDQRLMMVMNWSVLNGGSDWKLNDEKQARYMELTYRLDDQQRRVIQALSAQYATLESTRERLAGGYKELDSISSAAKSMSARMVSGNQSLLDMLDVYDRYYQARTRLVSLHIQEMTATSQIARLVQGNPNPEITNTPSLGGN